MEISTLTDSPNPTHKECLRNHAASLGRLSLDGCLEFMPSPSSPLSCAACSCHRNFHRRISHSDDEDPLDSPSPPPISSSFLPNSAPHLLISLSGPPPPAAPIQRKRFRTKFSQDQKEKMMGFAAQIGWKMQRCNDDLVARFCTEVGVERGVFKIWMHNNKNHFFKRDLNLDFGNTNGGANGSSSTS